MEVTQEHWTLPADFTALLARPLDAVLDELVPPAPPAQTPLPAPRSKKAETPAFLKALGSMPSANMTTNGALGHASTGEALLDLFNDLAPGISGEDAFQRLEAAWDADPELTLRIVFHARSIHEGKGFKLGFFRAVSWLYEKHPRTLLANLHMIVDPTCERKRSKKRDEAKAARKLAANEVMALDDEGQVEKDDEPEYPPRPHGSFDDLNDLLMLAVNGQLGTSYIRPFTAVDGALAHSANGSEFKRARLAAKAKVMDEKEVGEARKSAFSGEGAAARRGRKSADEAAERRGEGRTVEVEKDPTGAKDFLDIVYRLSKCSSKEMRVAVLKERSAKALADRKIQALYAAIVDLYAAYLSADLARLDEHNKYLLLPEKQRSEEGYGKPGSSPHLFGMSYAAKWAPTPGKSADKQLHVAIALALRLFANKGLDAKTARRKLQAEVLTPLRRVLAVPETKMVKGAWSIEYSKVPARAMARYKESFAEHDPEGFEKYLMAVAQGKGSIAGASMMPHNLLSEALYGGDIGARVTNLQWASLVDSVRSSSDKELSNCIAVADVSGSMGSLYQKLRPGAMQPQPIWPCIALTLLLSELARPPWNGAFITFSGTPKLEHIDTSLRLSERAHKLEQAHWSMNTNYHRVFREILDAAVRNKLAPEDMVKRIFVFSDMQFDESQGTAFGETEHEGVVRMFAEAGYDVPEMVYWNLQASATKPVAADTPGTSLVSGFSGALMKYFIRALGEDPEEEDEAMDEDGDKGADDAMDEDWEEVKTEVDAIESEATPKEKKEKAKKTPLQHMMAIIGTRPFDGIVVVD